MEAIYTEEVTETSLEENVLEFSLEDHLRPSSQPTSEPTSVPSLSPPPEQPLFSNATIIVTATVILLILAGMLLMTFQNHKVKVDENKWVKPRRTFKTFFEELIPLEFRMDQYWEQLYYKQLLYEHDFICPYSGRDTVLRGSERVERDIYDKVSCWGIGCGKVLAYLFLCTLLISNLYNDPGSCENVESSDECLGYTEYSFATGFSSKPLCQWKESIKENKCAFSYPGIDFMTILTQFTIVVLVETGIDKIIRCLMRHSLVMVRTNWDWFFKVDNTPPVYPAQTRNDSRVSSGGDVENGKFDFDIVEDFNHHDTVIGDEMVVYQSKRVTILRAAVFKRMKDTIDFVTPEEELRIMLDIWMNPKHPLNFNPWMPKKEQWLTNAQKSRPAYSFDGPRGDEIEEKTNCFDATAAILKSWQMDMYDISDPYIVLDMLIHNHATPYGKDLIVRKLERSRQCSDLVKNELRLITQNIDKDRFLINKFITESYCGYRRTVCESVVFHPVLISMSRVNQRYLQFGGLWLVPLFFLGTTTYIFVAGSSLGQDYCYIYGNNARTYHWGCDQWNPKTSLWLALVLMVLFFDVIILQPMKILVKWVYIPWQAKESYMFQHAALTVRSKGILSRKTGLMKNANSLIQHFNPVCRAARSVPHLPCARLMMTLTDYDLPYPLSLQQKHMHLFDKNTFMGKKGDNDDLYYETQEINWNIPLVGTVLAIVCGNCFQRSLFVFKALFFYYPSCLAGMLLAELLLAPEWFQLLLLEWTIIAIFCGYLMLLYLTSEVSMALPPLLVILPGCAISAWLYKDIVSDRYEVVQQKLRHESLMKSKAQDAIRKKQLELTQLRAAIWSGGVGNLK